MLVLLFADACQSCFGCDVISSWNVFDMTFVLSSEWTLDGVGIVFLLDARSHQTGWDEHGVRVSCSGCEVTSDRKAS